MAKRWTQKEIDFLKENYLTMTDKEMIPFLPSRSWQAIGLRRRMLGLTKPTILPMGNAAMRQRYAEYKNRANRKGLAWKLTLSDFHLLCQQDCYYCGAKPSQIIRVKRCNGVYTYNGLDRIDNLKGYELGNIVTCCGICNRAKGQLTYSQFYEWVNRLYNNWIDA